MRTYGWQFAAWLAAGAASTALRVAYDWPAARIAESAAIVVLSAVALRVAARTRFRGRREWATIATLMLGWLAITAVGAIISGDLVAGIDTALYLPAVVLMWLPLRRLQLVR